MQAIQEQIHRLQPEAQVEIVGVEGPFYESVFQFRPDAILTFPFTSVGFAKLYYNFKRKLGCRIVCFRAEGILDIRGDEKNIEWTVGYDRYGKYLVDYELFWGPEMASVIGERLLSLGKISSASRVIPVGYPRLEKYFQAEQRGQSSLPDRIALKLSQYPRDRVLLFLTGFHLANYSAQNLLDAKDLDAENRMDELLEAVERSKRYRAEWTKAVRHCCEQYGEALVILKKHPNERREDYAALEIQGADNFVYAYEDFDLDQLVERAGVMVHYGSTSVVDAYLCGIPTVYVAPDQPILWFTDLGFINSRHITLREIPATVGAYLNGEVKFSHDSRLEAILSGAFNIWPERPYQPSLEIAKILVRPEPAQRIPLSDRYLWKAMPDHWNRALRMLVRRVGILARAWRVVKVTLVRCGLRHES
ncbi:MAG: hypothetical protein JSR62_13865 [Nitrospira sp.]|nr:hypothetical protein [Nitrospira sp.]